MILASRKFPMRTKFLEFRRIAHRLSTSHHTIYYHPSSGKSRLSVVVPKKTNKLAVVRSWLRRLSYDATWPDLKDKNIDMVLVYKPIKITKSPQSQSKLISELQAELAKL